VECNARAGSRSQRGGSPVVFSTRAVKGVDYGVFTAVGGTYTAVYG